MNVDMTKDINSKQDLVNYVIKFNDREYQKRSASGLTLWSLFGAIAYITYQSLDLVPLINEIPAVGVFLISLITLSNSLLWFSALLTVLTSRDQRKILTEVDVIRDRVRKFGMLIVGLTFGAANQFFYLYFNIVPVPRWPFIVMSCSFFSAVLLLIYDLWIDGVIWKLKSNYFYRPKLKHYILWPIISYKVWVIICLIMMVVSTIPLHSLLINYIAYYQKNIFVIKATASVIALISLIFAMYYQYANFFKARRLEELELKLIIEDMTYDEARKLVSKEISSFSVANWLSELEENIKILHHDTIDKIISLKSSVESAANTSDDDWNIAKKQLITISKRYKQEREHMFSAVAFLMIQGNLTPKEQKRYEALVQEYLKCKVSINTAINECMQIISCFDGTSKTEIF
ncbi:hypothetical protein [Anaerospora sp.]|uniref:hypothetical protein n=1 Tax=Anaerospora sp. TaxID=1960278 RepID=UPI00289BBF8A|nr:hypothetical protein [Anaerospora sp.]